MRYPYSVKYSVENNPYKFTGELISHLSLIEALKYHKRKPAYLFCPANRKFYSVFGVEIKDEQLVSKDGYVLNRIHIYWLTKK